VRDIKKEVAFLVAGQTFAMSTGSVAVFVGLAIIGFLFGFLRSKRR